MTWFETKRRAIVIVDLVESVRLIQSHEAETISGWLQVVRHTEQALLPAHGGRLIKSLGDGMLLDFTAASDALAVATGIQAFSRAQNDTLPEDRKLHLRVGINTGEVMEDVHDIYGHSVNVAARLAALAGPGEIVASASAIDQMSMAEVPNAEDLGDCYLKHVEAPVRAYRVRHPDDDPIRIPAPTSDRILPTLAVIPFTATGPDADAAIGHIIAEELIRSLGQLSGLNVISRLSTSAFTEKADALGQIGGQLRATHALAGRVIGAGGKLVLSLDLTEVQSGEMIWTERYTTDLATVMSDLTLQASIAEAVAKAILRRELARVRAMPVRSLDSYSLLLGAIHLMYRLSHSDFRRAEEMLQAVIDRNPRQSLPYAWMGNWHVLNVQQGWNVARTDEYQKAAGLTARALDLNPDCEYALTFDGFVGTNLGGDYENTLSRYDAALEQNPNTSLAWLLKGTLLSYRGEDADAISCSLKGQSLSPLDPHRYFYDCLIGGCYTAAGDYEAAYPHLLRSLRQNAHHTSTLRLMTVVQWVLGKEDESRQTMDKLMQLQPSLTVNGWMREYGRIKLAKVAPRIFELAGMPVS